MDEKAAEKSILDHIHELVDEEKQLRAGHEGLAGADRDRLQAVEVELDRCWDLLRQRRARVEAHENPEDVSERSGNEVEGYLQ